MISLRIKDTKVFMSQLLIKDTFDRMLLSEATIKTACSYTINGQINKEYYSDEEWDNLNNNESLIQNGVILSHSVLVLLRVIKFLLL